MKRLKYLALVALVGVWACDDSGTQPQPVSGTISGTVTIEGSGASGITVSLSSGGSATTDGSGNYSFANVAAGAYTVTISDFPTDVTFSSTSKAAAIQTAGQTVPVDFSGSFIRTSSIVGNVSAGGSGIAGVSVAATGPGGTQNKVTDANGNYTVTGLRAGSYTVVITDIPDGYTFATTTKTVTVGVGATEQAQFTGTKDVDAVTASVLIKSVTKTNTATPVNPSAVVGQIDVTLAIEPGTNQLSKVCVLLDDAEVPNGCQTLSSAVAGAEGGPEAAATFEPVFTILTGAFDGETGEPMWLDANHTLSAVVNLTNAAQSSVETSMTLTFANPDVVVATVAPGVSAVGTLAPNSGRLFYGGDQTVNLLPVMYSGKSLASTAVTFYQGPGTGTAISSLTATTLPGSVVFAGDDDLAGYQSPAMDVDHFNISAALYTDGTSATPVVGTTATGPNGSTHNIDEVAPPALALNLTDQVDDALDGLACCANNWVGPDYVFEDGIAGGPAVDAAGGVGIGTTTFHVGDPGDTDAEVAANPAVETGADAGLDLSFVNTENTVVAVYTDLVGNQTMVRLSSNGSNNPLTTFGYDNTMPTSFAVAAGSEPNQIIYNIANPGPGLGLNFGAVEDRAGFSSVPISGYLAKMGPSGTTYPIAQDIDDGGPISLGFNLATCGGAAPTSVAPCYPTNTTAGGDALWMFDAAAQDQAGNLTGTHLQRQVLVDGTAPTTQNVALPPQVVAGSSVTYSAPVTDNHELWAVAFGTDFETVAGSGVGDGVYLPFGENVVVGDGNRWDDNFPTSATAVLTLSKSIVARELATGGAPTGDVGVARNVRAITTDAAGNQSAPFANNFILGTVDPTPSKRLSYASATPALNTTNWEVSGPAAATSLCNGQGGTACDVAPGGTDVKSLTMTIVAEGVTGSYNNPFGSTGVIYIYANIPTGGFYTATNSWYLIGSISAASAAITDDGATRTYTWTFTVTDADVAAIADGTNIGLVAMGLNGANGTLLVSDPNMNVTVVNGS